MRAMRQNKRSKADERGDPLVNNSPVDVILQGDVLDRLRELPEQSVNCCVTSPPYWGLRDYGVAGQLGLEKTPKEYVAKMVEVFSEVKRVLRDDGTLWLNLGDSYYRRPQNETNPEKNAGLSANRGAAVARNSRQIPEGFKEKDLVGIPWRVAFALQEDGWYLRQDIIWSKPNPMPESVRDRCTKAHEYVFLLSKKPKYFYDCKAIAEPTLTSDNTIRDRDTTKLNNVPGRTRMGGLKTNNYEFRNKRDVWNIPCIPYKDAHFATFPENLIEPMIKAGCPEGGLVLDSFMGAGTTALVARKLNRHFLGIELNPSYIDIAMRRIKPFMEQKKLAEVCL